MIASYACTTKVHAQNQRRSAIKYSVHLSRRQIAAALNLSVDVVSKYLAAAARASLSYPLPDEMSDPELEQLIFASASAAAAVSTDKLPVQPPRFTQPDFEYLHHELKKKAVTLQLLWEEYREQHSDSAYRYTQFCYLYRRWKAKLKTSMRQTHRAGEKLFVDYAGQIVLIVNVVTGETREAQIFVAVLGASNYCFAEATTSQQLPDWSGSHVRAFEFFGSTPQLVVPDNLKSGVTKPCRYEPEINATYADLAAHYNVAVLPARPRKPKDKAKVEVGVQVVERWVLARLRHHTFFSLAELNRAIAALVVELNNRPFKRLAGCRRSLFEQLDRPALNPLPAARYEYAEWKKVRVNIDYHVEVDGHYYSVPHQLVKAQLDVRLTARIVEVFHRSERVADHARSLTKAAHSTLPEHMLKAHRAMFEWTPGRLLKWSLEVGENCRDLVKHLLTTRAHPEQGYRSCLGLLNLSKRYGSDRLEAACRRALALGSPTRKSVISILERRLDRLPLVEEVYLAARPTSIHENIRGAAYYASGYEPQSNNEQPQPFEALELEMLLVTETELIQ